MTLVSIHKDNAHIFDVLVQGYKAEFLAMTHKEPNQRGVFTVQVRWEKPYQPKLWIHFAGTYRILRAVFQ